MRYSASHENYGGEEIQFDEIGRELQFEHKMTDVSCADDKNEMLGARKSLRTKWALRAPGAGDKNEPDG